MRPTRSLHEQKTLLRKELRQRLAAQKPAEREEQSRKILKQLFDHPRFQKAGSVFFYVAQRWEVETRPILDKVQERGKRAFVPRIDPTKKLIQMIEIRSLDELCPGSYGILEPSHDIKRLGDPKSLDLAVIPGVGFDRQGGRLGRGEGYFDRFLSEALRTYKIGLAFECQVVEHIPREAHDARVDEVLIG